MGSMIQPLATFGNPTGIDPGFGFNPNFAKETMKGLQSLVPSGGISNVVPLGTAGSTPFISTTQSQVYSVPANPPTTINPSTTGQGGNPNTWHGQDPITGLPLPAPPSPTTLSVPGGNTIFGYPTPLPAQNLAGLTPGGPGGGVQLSASLKKNLDKTYGKGFSNLLQQMIGLRGGFNPAVANAFINAIQPYFQRNMNDLMELFGATGQRFASTAALAGGQFAADFTAKQQALFAQMYMWAFENYQNTLGAALNAAKKNTSSNIWAALGNVAGAAQTGVNILQGTGVIGSYPTSVPTTVKPTPPTFGGGGGSI